MAQPSGEGSSDNSKSPLWLKGAGERSETGGSSDGNTSTIPPQSTSSAGASLHPKGGGASSFPPLDGEGTGRKATRGEVKGGTIADFLNMSTRALADVGIPTARLDSELLLISQLGLSREWILAHDDAEITPDIWAVLCRQVYERAQRQPVAYLTGGKDFYSRHFLVNPNVLIPRPESEQIIDSLHRLFDRQLFKKRNSKLRLLDIGTGSGCLAITAKLEFPNLDVTATDISPAALETAKLNALRLHAKLRFITSDLFSGLDNFKQDIIVANLPYVDIDWDDLSPELIYEPQIALFAEDHGLELIKQLLVQVPDRLRNRTGYLILEMDRRQIDEILTFAKPLGYRLICRKPFTITLFLPQPTEGEED